MKSTLPMILTMATTDFNDGWKVCRDPDSEQRTQVLMIDISRAYFNAKTSDDDPIYVELPQEAEAPEGMCALLKRHMYGTRRAADGWQATEEYGKKEKPARHPAVRTQLPKPPNRRTAAELRRRRHSERPVGESVLLLHAATRSQHAPSGR